MRVVEVIRRKKAVVELDWGEISFLTASIINHAKEFEDERFYELADEFKKLWNKIC